VKGSTVAKTKSFLLRGETRRSEDGKGANPQRKSKRLKTAGTKRMKIPRQDAGARPTRSRKGEKPKEQV